MAIDHGKWGSKPGQQNRDRGGHHFCQSVLDHRGVHVEDFTPVELDHGAGPDCFPFKITHIFFFTGGVTVMNFMRHSTSLGN